jgi:hypothetical protein
MLRIFQSFAEDNNPNQIGGQVLADDFAYGATASRNLAAGTFDRSTVPYGVSATRNAGKKPKCPSSTNPKIDGICSAATAERNADTYALIAAGVWFSKQCPSNPIHIRSLDNFLFDRDTQACSVRGEHDDEAIDSDPNTNLDVGQPNNGNPPPATQTKKPCMLIEDPDGAAGGGEWCACNNGMNVPVASPGGKILELHTTHVHGPLHHQQQRQLLPPQEPLIIL